MSEPITETTTDEPVEIMLEGFADESRVNVERSIFEGARALYEQALKTAKRATAGATTAYKAAAKQRVAIRAMILRGNGFPDWGGASDAYSLTIQAVENSVLGAMDPASKRTMSSAIRQHVSRTYLLRGVVEHVLATENAGGTYDADLERFTSKSDPEEAILEVIGNMSQALKHRVQAHYAAAKLTDPFTDNASGGGNDPADPANPLATLEKGLDGLGQITPAYAALGLLKATSSVAQNVKEQKGDIPNRARALEFVKRSRQILYTLEKALAAESGKEVTAEDWESLTPVLFNAENDRIDS